MYKKQDKNVNPAKDFASKSQSFRENYKIFFEDQNTINYKTIKITILTVLCFLFIYVVLRISPIVHFNGTGIYVEESKVNALNKMLYADIGSYSLTILISILSAVVATICLNRDNIKRNLAVRELAHDDLLNAVFSTLSSFNKCYKFDQRILAKLTKVLDNENIFLLTISISTYTNITKNIIDFKFNRFDSSNLSDSSGIDIFEYEFLMNLDETALLKRVNGKKEDLNKYYSVKSVSLNNRTDLLEIIDSETEEGKKYRFRINEKIDTTDSYKFEYVFTMPMPDRSYFYFTALFPVKGFHVTFDYSGVADKINIHCTDLLSSTTLNSKNPSPKENIFEIRHNGWVIPKSSVVFYWFDKRTTPNAPTRDNDQETGVEPSPPKNVGSTQI